MPFISTQSGPEILTISHQPGQLRVSSDYGHNSATRSALYEGEIGFHSQGLACRCTHIVSSLACSRLRACSSYSDRDDDRRNLLGTDIWCRWRQVTAVRKPFRSCDTDSTISDRPPWPRLFAGSVRALRQDKTDVPRAFQERSSVSNLFQMR